MTEPFLAPQVSAPLPQRPPRRVPRAFPPNPFADDDGTQPPEFAVAKAVAHPERTLAVVRVLAEGRVLVPILAHAHPGRTADGGVAGHLPAAKAATAEEACEQASATTVELADGRRAMPIFTSMAAMRQWSPDARPVPVYGTQAARAAARVGEGLMLLDPGDEAVVIPRPAVLALATERDWVPAWGDRSLEAVTAAALAAMADVTGVRLEPGRTTEIRVVVGLRRGLNADRLRDVIGRISTALADDPVLRERVDSIELYPTSLA